jgi:tripartite ATP-independent transporter DctM subunit
MNIALEASLVLFFSFALLLTIGVPIAVCIVLASITTILLICPFNAAVFTTAQKMVSSLDTFSLLAVPFFILSGVIMNNGGIALQLVNLAKLVSGRIPGSLTHTNIVGNMMFGALSGSAIAASTSIGSVMVPMSVREGYDRGFAAAANIASAPVGMITPPTSSFIIYAIVSGGTSVAALFIAGAAAGTLWCLGTMITAYIITKRKGYRNLQQVTFDEGVRIVLQALPSLLMLVVVVGGIVAGIFTAVEASAVAVVYTFVLSFIFYRSIPFSKLKAILIQTAQMTGVIMLLIAASSAMSFAMAFTGIPKALTDVILMISDNKYVILMIINVLLLLVGAFLDIGPAILIFTPILLPIVTSVGVDPIHFGVILVYNLCIGTITPPVGTGLFVGAQVGQIKIEQVLKPLIPFYIGIIFVLFLITYIPWLTMYWPRLFGL